MPDHAPPAHIVVVGAGQAGAALVAKLRASGYGGRLTLIGEEAAPPYQRPPLSKAYLLGEIDEERLWLRSDSFWQEHDITLKLGARVLALDAEAKTVTLAGEVLPYDELVLATGAEPRRLPAAIGGDLAGVYPLRSLADIARMRAEFQPGRRLVVVGGGYIGLEAAAVARKIGLSVTVVEAAPRILGRVAAAETADYFRALHHAHGVRIIEGVGVARLAGTGRVEAVVLEDGREIAADFVVAGVGITPASALAESAGLAIENGIRTDARGRSSRPHIWAAGDCASFPLNGGQARLESVGHAIDHAELVAANLLGAAQDYHAKPWFWSDQYGCKLQIAGLNTGYDRIVRRAPPDSDAARDTGPDAGPVAGPETALSIWYYRGDRLLAVDAMNDPRAYMVGKRLIEAQKTADPALVADPASDLKLLLR